MRRTKVQQLEQPQSSIPQRFQLPSQCKDDSSYTNVPSSHWVSSSSEGTVHFGDSFPLWVA